MEAPIMGAGQCMLQMVEYVQMVGNLASTSSIFAAPQMDDAPGRERALNACSYEGDLSTIDKRGAEEL